MINTIKKGIFIVMIIGGMLLAHGMCYAQETVKPDSTLTVETAVICEGVDNHEPVSPGSSFPVSIGKLHCFTKIIGATGQMTVTHVWFFGDVERARVPLDVKAAAWRTHSSKLIQAHEVGAWHVDILGPDGYVLATVAFETTL